MRERWVQIVALASGALAVLLALAFARIQNPHERPAARAPAASPALAAGRAVYEAQRCALCHAIGGAGNPRFPLDGVGARRDAAALRDWTLATGAAAAQLSARAAAAKRGYRELPPAELDALVAYLASLRDAPAGDGAAPGAR